jgi:GR25 family glycosyltransferase involved in LPS biosynthesis
MFHQLYFKSPIENNWEIIQIVDENNNDTNYIAVRSEIKNEATEKCLKKLLTSGKKIIGLSSYQEFPGRISNPYEPSYPFRFVQKYASHIVLWCHCFRHPEQYIPKSIPYFLYSETDQYSHILSLNNKVGTKPKLYDFFASIPEGNWNSYIRGLSIAQRWLNFMADHMNLKILVVGTNRRINFSSQITVIDFQKWCDFIDHMNSCKYLFCSSIYDASPRIIVEAMSLNMPVLLNKNILGGWKYIQDSTGMFFDSNSNIPNTINSFVSKDYNPMEYTKTYFTKQADKLAQKVNEICSPMIDGIIYINLDNRPDRKAEIINELRKMHFTKIYRIQAINDRQCGHLGCAKSHVLALKLAKNKGWYRFLIVEDDFVFKVNRQNFNETLTKFYLNCPNWGVFMLTSYHLKAIPFYQNIKKVIYGSTAAGYIVNGSFVDILLQNFQEAIELLENDVKQFIQKNPGKKKMTTPYAIDVHWNQLQNRGYFYISEPTFGNQSGSPSSIMKL